MTAAIPADRSSLINSPANQTMESRGIRTTLNVSMTAGAISTAVLVTFVAASNIPNFVSNNPDLFVYGCLGSALTAFSSLSVYTGAAIYSFCKPPQRNNREVV